MKKLTTNLLLIVISIVFASLITILGINIEYQNSITRTPFDYAWFGIYVQTSSMFLIVGTIFLVFSCKNIHDLYHSGIIKNILQRMKYSNFKTNLLIKSWGSSFFFYPVFLLISYLICYFIFPTKGVGINLKNNGPMINSLVILIRNSIFTIMYSILVINITIIYINKIKHFSISAILSFMTVIIYSAISQMLFPAVLKDVINAEIIKAFDLTGGLLFGYGNSIYIVSNWFLLFLITIVILKKTYYNSNEVILHYENEN